MLSFKKSLAAFIGLAFVVGLIALFTPPGTWARGQAGGCIRLTSAFPNRGASAGGRQQVGKVETGHVAARGDR
jgi:hypothetical protein